MKLFLLFLCLMACSCSMKVTEVSRNYEKSLPASTFDKKYFYLTNYDYYLYSSYIYFSLEDSNFDLSYDNIKYCLIKSNPSSNPENAVSSCSFNPISYYSSKILPAATKYYYKFSTNSAYDYSIIYYEGSKVSGSLYVISDYNDLTLSIKITQVPRNSKISLPTDSSYHKYFYLTNSDYYAYSNYMYFWLEEDNGFDLNYRKIRYCLTNTNPDSNPGTAIGCSYESISYYSHKRASNGTKFYYKLSTNNFYTYSIIYYEGIISSGNLYVISDYNDLSLVKLIQVSRNSRTSLPTTISYDNYFYLTNSNYYKNSSYIYFCLEDSNFDLSYNKIKYCLTNSDPSSYPEFVTTTCSYNSISISYYSIKSFFNATKYYYK